MGGVVKNTITLLVLTILFFPNTSWAQSYDRFMADAKVAFDANNYRKAIKLLLKANRLKPESKNLFRVARSYEELNDCGMAIVYYKAFLKEKGQKKSRRRTAKKAIRKSRSCGNYTPELSGRFFIKSSPSGVGVTIDGENIGVTPVEIAGFIEGQHQLDFERRGYSPVQKTITMKRGSDDSLFVKLAKKVEEEVTEKPLPKSDKKSRKLSIGLLFGVSYNQINTPKDPAGEPTLLFGSAYKGSGFTGGLSLNYDVFELGPGALSARIDLLGAINNASGFAKNVTQNYERTLEFSETSIRIPLLLGYTLKLERSRLFLLGGVDIVAASIKTSSTLSQDNGTPPEPIGTSGPNPVSLLGVFGYGFGTQNWIIPIDLRINYNPFTKKSTKARFGNYISATSPGAYQVAFDWQIFVTLGIMRIF